MPMYWNARKASGIRRSCGRYRDFIVKPYVESAPVVRAFAQPVPPEAAQNIYCGSQYSGQAEASIA
jgi:hypothetical protein